MCPKGGRGAVVARELFIDLWEVPIVHCTSYCKEAAKAGLQWCLCNRVGERRHKKKKSRPALTDKQRVGWVAFVLSHLHRRGGSGVLVDDVFDWVHVDEKGFYLMKDGKKNLPDQPDEEFPKSPRASNKRFILKMIFLAAVACPRKLSSGVRFGGNIGIWLKVVDVVAERARGDSVLRPVTLYGEDYDRVIDEIIPTIKAKAARLLGHTVFEGQDDAKWHMKKGVTEARILAEAGNSIRRGTQPCYLNVTDLGLFLRI
ncbi:unnamed protein product [Discosporangium mesarthrocarpum]